MARPAPGAPWASLAADRVHGAHALALRALALLERDLRSGRHARGGTTSRRAVAWARGLRTAQPAMGALVRLGDWVDEERRHGGSEAELRRRLLAGVRRARRRLRREPPAVVATVRRAFPPRARVVTFSRSETVLRALVALPASRRPAEVRAARSVPGGEGARLARELRRAGLSAGVVEDRALARALRGATIVLVGADAVYRDGSLVHKVGTRALARVAARARVPLVSLAGRSKVVDRPPPGVWRGPALFDLTPARWVRAYWTDAGVRAPGMMGRGDGLIRPRTR